jgi:hypothetical protein
LFNVESDSVVGGPALFISVYSRSLYADVDADVRSGAELLDKKVER